MVAFLVLLYAVYLLTLVINGILLRAGVLSGPAPAGLTIVPAAIAGGVIVVFLLIALVPGDLAPLLARLAGEVLGPDGEAPGHRPVDRRGRHPRGARLRPRARAGGLAILGAVGFWAAQIGILWAAFHAFDAEVPLAVVIQGFFVGMFANLIPCPAGWAASTRG